MEILLRVVGGPGRLVASLGRLMGCAGLTSVRRADRAGGSKKMKQFFDAPDFAAPLSSLGRREGACAAALNLSGCRRD
jgi:hypothetical protein